MRTAGSLNSGNFTEFLDPTMKNLLHRCFQNAGAHEGAVWLVDGEGKSLVISHAWGARAENVLGYAQTLERGLVSMVLATEQPFCEDKVYTNRLQARAKDEKHGVLTSSIIAVPLGIAMGAHKGLEAFLEPFVSFCRYLPASAFIPLLILWAGIGELQKVLVIFIGSVFQILLMVAVSVGSARKDLVEAAYTLGAQPSGIVKRVLIPGAAPDIAEILRLVLGWAWTYVIVAELIGASSGIGHMITDSQALLATDQIIFGIIVIGLIGLVIDFAFKALNRKVFPWARI